MLEHSKRPRATGATKEREMNAYLYLPIAFVAMGTVLALFPEGNLKLAVADFKGKGGMALFAVLFLAIDILGVSTILLVEWLCLYSTTL